MGFFRGVIDKVRGSKEGHERPKEEHERPKEGHERRHHRFSFIHRSREEVPQPAPEEPGKERAFLPAASSKVHWDLQQNDTRALAEPLGCSAFAWQLSGAKWITETQNYYLLDEERGACLFLQVAWSNLSWPRNAVQTSVRYYGPGVNVLKSHTSVAGKMRTADLQGCGKIGMSIATSDSTIAIGAASREPGQAGRTDMPALALKGASKDPKGLSFSLVFTPVCEGLAVKGGTISFGSGGKEGFISNRFWPLANVAGTITYQNKSVPFKGRGIGIRQFHGIKPYVAARQWNMASFVGASGKETSALLLHLETAKAYDSVHFNQGFIVVDGVVEAVVVDTAVRATGLQKDEEMDYYIPTAIEYQWSGVDRNGRGIKAHIMVEKMNLVAKVMVLDALPLMFRKIVEAIVSRPALWQWVNPATLVIEREGQAPMEVQGNLYHEFSLINHG